MGTALNLTYANAILKYLYSDSVASVVNVKSPFLGSVKKGQFIDTGGLGHVIPCRAGLGGGGSHTIADAQTYAIPGITKSFVVTTISDYVVKYIDGRTMASMMTKRESLVNGLTEMMDEAFGLAKQRMQIEAFGDKSASLAKCTGSSVSTVYVTLDNKYDAYHFHVGMEVESAATATGSTRTGSATIVAINYADGILQTDTNWTSQITNFCTGSNDDFLFAVGDSCNSSTVLGVAGLSAWLPPSASRLAYGGGDSFFGVDRGINDNLYGLYFDGSSYTNVREAIIRAQTEFNSRAGDIDTIILPPHAYRQYLLETEAKETIVRYAQTQRGAVASIGYKGVELIGDKGPIAILCDPYCPKLAAFFLNMDSWSVLSAGGDMPRILNFDNGKLLTVSNADTAELRIGGYYNLACFNPGLNGRMLLKSYS